MSAIFKYRQTQGETASRERLMIMLFETALRHMRSGISLLSGPNPREAVTPLTKASDIVDELRITLKHDVAPELCQKLADLYKFVELRLTTAAITLDAKTAREAELAFAPLVPAFTQALQRAAAK